MQQSPFVFVRHNEHPVLALRWGEAPPASSRGERDAPGGTQGTRP